MTLLFTLYIGLAACALVGLSVMIFKVGDALADCPVTGRAAKAGSLTIVTGFVAIGLGGVLLIGAAAMVVPPTLTVQAVVTAFGISVLCLGLGFSQAIATLRDVIAQASEQAKA